jgi:hypothetical protein
VSKLEAAARRLWREWGSTYAKFTACEGCGEFLYCRSPGRRVGFYCLACFDQGEHRRRRQARLDV